MKWPSYFLTSIPAISNTWCANCSEENKGFYCLSHSESFAYVMDYGKEPGKQWYSETLEIKNHYCIPTEICIEFSDLIGPQAVRTRAYRLTYGQAHG